MNRYCFHYFFILCLLKIEFISASNASHAPIVSVPGVSSTVKGSSITFTPLKGPSMPQPQLEPVLGVQSFSACAIPGQPNPNNLYSCSPLQCVNLGNPNPNNWPLCAPVPSAICMGCDSSGLPPGYSPSYTGSPCCSPSPVSSPR